MVRGPVPRKPSTARMHPSLVWAGDGAKEGNEALIKRGAVRISELDSLFAIQQSVRPDSPVQQTFPI